MMTFGEIPIFSNNGHIELNTGLSDTTFNADYPIKVVPYTSGKILSARLIFLFFFGSVFEYIHCNKYQNFNKFQPTDSEL